MKELVLVTGGTGFVGAHCIIQLLNAGYPVRTTLRSLTRASDIQDMVKAGGASPGPDALTFAEADLTSDSGWADAMKGCTYVLHVASPIALAQPKDENDFIKPAVEGTLRVLRAARDAGIKRVVMTSSFGAVSYGYPDKNRTFTESDWTDLNDKSLSPYVKSKTLAEQAAWDFIASEGGALELTVINPVGIFGPTLSSKFSSAFQILDNLLTGKIKAAPKINFAVVDVRDVADLHIRAMTAPEANGKRFIAANGDPLSIHDMAMILRRTLGDGAAKVTTKELPDIVIRLAALFDPKVKEVPPLLGKTRYADSTAAKTILGWTPHTNVEAVTASAQSMMKFR